MELSNLTYESQRREVVQIYEGRTLSADEKLALLARTLYAIILRLMDDDDETARLAAERDWATLEKRAKEMKHRHACLAGALAGVGQIITRKGEK